MSSFLTPLRMELMTCNRNIPLKNRDGRQLYRLTEPFVYQSDIVKSKNIPTVEDGIIITPAGYITDLASIPRMPLVYRELEGIADMGGVPHDRAYSTGIIPRDVADLMLKEACFLIGLPAWKVWAIYAGVRVGGQSHYMRS